MYTVFLTYDLSYADSDDYADLYDLIEQYKGQCITESTYKIAVTDDWKIFKKKLINVTHSGDNVKAIVLLKDNNGNKYIDYLTIR